MLGGITNQGESSCECSEAIDAVRSRIKRQIYFTPYIDKSPNSNRLVYWKSTIVFTVLVPMTQESLIFVCVCVSAHSI